MSKQIEKRFLEIQENILDNLLSLESPKNRKPIVDNWKSKIGKGKTCVVENGAVFEKAVVTFSSISGKKLPISSGISKKSNKTIKFKLKFIIKIRHCTKKTKFLKLVYFKSLNYYSLNSCNRY